MRIYTPQTSFLHLGALNIKALYSPVPQLGPSGAAILQNPAHSLHIKTQRLVADRDKNTLWWLVTSPLAVANKSVVRNRATRRLRQGMKEALETRGYDREGRGRDGKENLTGYLRITTEPQALTASFESIKSECLRVVDRLARLQERCGEPQQWPTDRGVAVRKVSSSDRTPGYVRRIFQ
ncbi:hypothetical protein BJ546DRAFT_66870 [Cryomyces antarcticus]|nr:hypothetical protein LTR60_002462 [Cryomyces antarcticus]